MGKVKGGTVIVAQARPNAQHYINGEPVVTEGPDGFHGKGRLIASADAYAVRPQGCAPVMRQLLFGRQ